MKNYSRATKGGATIEYAVFLAAVAVMVLSGVMVLGDQLRPQMVAWRDNYGIDRTTMTGSVQKMPTRIGETSSTGSDGKTRKRYIIRKVVPEFEQ